MGNKNAVSLPKLQLETQSGMYDMILHVGDFAYDMFNVSTIIHLVIYLYTKHVYLIPKIQENGKRGDQFMRQIEPIAAYVPYMTCPGNHEYM